MSRERVHRARAGRPPREALAWVEQTIGSGARVVAARRLTGGLTSRVHLVAVEANGRRSFVVLRRWGRDGMPRDWVEGAMARETAVLAALERTDIPAPRILGATVDDAHGGPTVLMTRVPGRVHLVPADMEHWLRQMARMLARIHALNIEARRFDSWLDRERAAPSDATRADLWATARAAAAVDSSQATHGFIHRDFQHFNLLWTRGRLTGVVDWAGAAVGPPDIDVGHCRLNLTTLHSADAAERFRQIYEAESGRSTDPRWELHSLLSFGPDWKEFLPVQIDGRAQLDVDGMTRRVEDTIERTLRRL